MSSPRTMRSRGTGAGCAARKRSTRSARVAAGTWDMSALSRIRDERRPLSLSGEPEEGCNGVMQVITVGIGPLAADEVVAVARHGATVRLSEEAEAGIQESRKLIEALADDVEPHYGVSTGFGALATRHIAPELRAQLQRSLV